MYIKNLQLYVSRFDKDIEFGSLLVYFASGIFCKSHFGKLYSGAQLRQKLYIYNAFV